MPKLYVIGDSFTHQFDNCPNTMWISRVAHELGAEVVNGSFAGVSQDFCWAVLQQWSSMITPEDYLIVAVTHPGRYWYIHDHPDLSNTNIIGLDQWVTPDQALAIEGYIRHIQRPALDTVQMVSRMGWLAYMVKQRGWRRPLMIKGFAMDLYETAQYPQLNWAQGELYSIQRDEFVAADDTSTEDHFKGMDCRYNHMCLRNHAPLAEKVVAAFQQDQSPDLTQGFHQHFLTQELIDNDEFFAQEFNLDVKEYYHKMREQYRGKRVTSWLDNLNKKLKR